MNPPKWDDLDSIHFLIAAQKVFTGTEAARCAPEEERAPAHDAFTRLLPRPPPDTEALGQEAKAFVDVGKGLLVLEDTTLDKPYAQKMDRVTDHWSGQHPRVVQGVALWTLLWTEGKALMPWDFRGMAGSGAGRPSGRKGVSMLGPLLLALRAFLRLESYRCRQG